MKQEVISKKLYRCPECGLHYENRALAAACEEFCSQHHACNMEIAKQAIENQPKA
ncbi:MAG: hypothetical protein UX30_C0006G0051 [Candidatus Saccharibacteria bacterium GW2011_GWA2_46_10]|nr:MAG: hypothetical protein UX30_C0006G0051 [Candidatus Saccharibacteria bacterium GW2011_GWA2_46_10]